MSPSPHRLILPALLLAAGATSPARAQETPPDSAAAVSVAARHPLLPDSVLAPPGFPRIVRLPAPGADVVTLRLSIPLDERSSEAGAGRVLEGLARARMAGPAAALGALLETGRTPWGLVYTITGPRADLDYLVYVLREGTRAPTTDPGSVGIVRQRLDERLRRQEETGGGRVEAALAREVSPGQPPLEGTRGTLAAVGGATLLDLWTRTHRPDAMTLLVAGEVADPVLLATLAGLGVEPGTEAAPPPDAPAPPSPTPGAVQTLRRWHGAAWATSGPLDPRAAVAALLLARRLREERSGYEAQVRLWETPERSVLAVVGAAYPRQAAELARRLSGLLEATAADLAAGEGEETARRARRDLLLQARTPWGRVHLVGRFLDAGFDAEAVTGYLDTLAGLDDDAVRTFLTELAASRTYTAEVRP